MSAPLSKGCRVQIRGLTGRSDLNGEEGEVRGDESGTGRWPVKCDNGDEVSVKTSNLVVLDGWPDSDDMDEQRTPGYDQLVQIADQVLH